MTSENLYQEITDVVHDTAKKILDSNKQVYPQWMSDESKAAIKNKHKVRQEQGAASSEYKKAKATSKILVKRDKMVEIERDLDIIGALPPSTQYYKSIKKLKTKPKNISWGIKDTDGTILTDKAAILERWANFYEGLYFDNSVADPINDSSEDPLPTILKSEVQYAIKHIKSGKSAGLDNIYTEYIKAGGEALVDALTLLFNRIIRTGTVPQAFKDALIVVLFKKGSMLDCGNYRPISLLSHIYKLFITLIANRVKNDLYDSFPASQAAYQPGRNTIEQVIALEQIIEKSIEFNNPVYIAFIDFTKAFDSIKLPSLWKILEGTCINKRYITLLKETYDGSTATIRTDLGNSRKVQILKGVKQGDTLSALLFCIVIASVLQKVEEDCDSGFLIGGQLISNLSYADDIAAVGTSVESLQKYLDALAKHAEEVGLHVNASKTKFMTTDKSQRILQPAIYGKVIECVSDFVYLGHKLSCINDGTTAVMHRIGLGWAAYEKNRMLLNSKRIPMHVKKKIYETYIVPVVLYGLDCVNWTSRLCRKIETFQNHIMRAMTNKTLLDHEKITDLRATTGLKPLVCVIKSRVLKLFGHVKRSQKGLSKVCIEGKVQGKRGKGRPPTRWLDSIKKWTGLTIDKLNTATQDRGIWKDISHVGAQSAVGGESEQ